MDPLLPAVIFIISILRLLLLLRYRHCKDYQNVSLDRQERHNGGYSYNIRRCEPGRPQGIISESLARCVNFAAEQFVGSKRERA